MDTLESLSGTIERLAGRVEQLEAGQLQAGDTRERTTVDGVPPAKAEPSEELVAWAKWLDGRYGLGPKLPSKWQEIPGAADELDALRHAWLLAYDAETGAPQQVGFEATQWHDALARVLPRIKAMYDDHKSREHQQ